MLNTNKGMETQGRALEEMGKILRCSLMDDFYMRCFFTDEINCIQFVLRVIMKDSELVVKSSTREFS